MNKLATHSRYLVETIRNKDRKLLNVSAQYALKKKLPTMDMVISNDRMGTYKCRSGTTDFMYSFYAYEYRVKEFILRHSSPGDYFFDIGACVGDYSILMSRSGRKSIAFEPSPDNFELLTENISNNTQAQKIKTFQCGLSDEEGDLVFTVPPDNKGMVSAKRKFLNGTQFNVGVQRFDSVISKMEIDYSETFVIKIDVEGMEKNVLMGMSEIWKKVQRAVLVYESKFSDEVDLLSCLPMNRIQKVNQVDEYNTGVIIE